MVSIASRVPRTVKRTFGAVPPKTVYVFWSHSGCCVCFYLLSSGFHHAPLNPARAFGGLTGNYKHPFRWRFESLPASGRVNKLPFWLENSHLGSCVHKTFSEVESVVWYIEIVAIMSEKVESSLCFPRRTTQKGRKVAFEDGCTKDCVNLGIQGTDFRRTDLIRPACSYTCSSFRQSGVLRLKSS